jgi:hypothetical protein
MNSGGTLSKSKVEPPSVCARFSCTSPMRDLPINLILALVATARGIVDSVLESRYYPRVALW